MQVVILCGGEGTRFRNFSEDDPKVLAYIGDRPILWHIMKYFQTFGFNDFILCLGHYRDKVIQEISSYDEGWKVDYQDTGLFTATGGRVKRIEKLIKGDDFFVTYGDGLSDVDINQLLKFHLSHRRIATLTTYRPFSQYGVLDTDAEDRVVSFAEKPRMNYYVNGGFFVFNTRIFSQIEIDENIETSLFTKLVRMNELMAFKHEGFWKSMDTFKENQELNDIWSNGSAPWLRW